MGSWFVSCQCLMCQECCDETCRTVFPAVGGSVTVTTISYMCRVDVCHSAVATVVSGVGAEHGGTGAMVGAV